MVLPITDIESDSGERILSRSRSSHGTPPAQAVLSFLLTFFTQRFRFFLSRMRLHFARGLVVLARRVAAPEPETDSGGEAEGRLQVRDVRLDQRPHRRSGDARVDTGRIGARAAVAPARDPDEPVDPSADRRLERPAAVAGAGVLPRSGGADHCGGVEVGRIVAVAGRVGDDVHRRRPERVLCPARLADTPPAADVHGAPGIPERPLVRAGDVDRRLCGGRVEHQVADVESRHPVPLVVAVVVRLIGDAADADLRTLAAI